MKAIAAVVVVLSENRSHPQMTRIDVLWPRVLQLLDG
jgi:hypothetical protein